jgi:hypothetical protein
MFQHARLLEGNADYIRTSRYTRQLKKWGFGKNLKATHRDCETVSYKVTKARKIGKELNVYFHRDLLTPRVLRGERFFLSQREEARLDSQSTLNLALLFLLIQ